MLGAHPTFLDRFAFAFVLKAGALRLPGGNEVMLAIANQVGTPHGFESLTQQGPVFCIVIAKEGLVQASLLHLFGDINVFTRSADPVKGVLAGVIHRCSVGHG